jgi:heat shock protein HtpX
LAPQFVGCESPRLGVRGEAVTIEMQLPTTQPGMALHCRIEASPRHLPLLRRCCERALNDRRSGQVTAAMVLLLALCGWAIGGDEAASRMVAAATPAVDDDPAVSPAAMQRRFGARLVRPTDLPALFDILAGLCSRAHLQHMPELYLIAAPDRMNAYALGGPTRSTITVTEGLLRGLSRGELVAILAHEVAHIRNNDTWAMAWAGSLQHAIGLAALAGLAGLRHRFGPAAHARPLAMLFGGASAIAQLLHMGLSRLREAEADALALEWIEDPQPLIAALHKLERHHAGAPASAAAYPEDDTARWLRSHPATTERIGSLMRLAG